MKSLLQVVALVALFVAASAGGSEAQEAMAQQASEAAAKAVARAGTHGVVMGRLFESTAPRNQAALQLVETEAAGASCQIGCSGGKVAGMVCAVGQMCQCSCMGGGPDCTCRKSN